MRRDYAMLTPQMVQWSNEFAVNGYSAERESYISELEEEWDKNKLNDKHYGSGIDKLTNRYINRQKTFIQSFPGSIKPIPPPEGWNHGRRRGPEDVPHLVLVEEDEISTLSFVVKNRVVVIMLLYLYVKCSSLYCWVFTVILLNVHFYIVECSPLYCWMFHRYIVECSPLYCWMFTVILLNVHYYIVECSPLCCWMFTVILLNVHRYIVECSPLCCWMFIVILLNVHLIILIIFYLCLLNTRNVWSPFPKSLPSVVYLVIIGFRNSDPKLRQHPVVFIWLIWCPYRILGSRLLTDLDGNRHEVP